MKFLLLLIPITLFCSCLEIIEEVNLKKDGSGTLAYTINLSQSKTKINSVMLLDSINGIKIPTEDDVRSKINEVLDLVVKTKGISNATKTLDFENYIFNFSCDFENTMALNKASELIKNAYNIHDPLQNTDDHFSYDSLNKTFRRKGDYKSETDLDTIKEDDLALMNEAEFTAIYRFEGEIKTVSNKDARISPNKKATMLKYPLMDLVSQKKQLENTIILK